MCKKSANNACYELSVAIVGDSAEANLMKSMNG